MKKGNEKWTGDIKRPSSLRFVLSVVVLISVTRDRLSSLSLSLSLSLLIGFSTRAQFIY